MKCLLFILGMTLKKFIEMIDYRLNLKTTKRIYARDTDIKIENVNKKHILDSPPVRNKICSVCFYYKDELVGLGVFNKYNDGAELKRLVFKKVFL